jgi:hypothetical protein
MNIFIKPTILFLLLLAFSCTDRGFTLFEKSIYFNNQSGQDLDIFFFKDQNIDTIQIYNYENSHYGIFDYDSTLPIDYCDSIFVRFDDNKMLKYFPFTDCSEKNIFCNYTYFCISGDTTVCQFLIDVDEYLKAKKN